MKVKVELEFDSVEEMMSHFGNIYTIKDGCGCHTHISVDTIPDGTGDDDTPEEEIKIGGTNGDDDEPVKREPGKPSPGKKRRTKAEIAEDEKLLKEQSGQTEEPEVVEENDDPVLGEGPPVIEDVRDVLNKLCAKFDIATGRDLLNIYGADRTSDLDQEKYGDFIKEAKEMINGA
jgi:hypothetical protein